MMIVGYIILIFTAFAGFILSFYIHDKKQDHSKMVCPLKSDCNAVIYSEYSKFLGVPVEIIGLFYYGFIAISYAFFLVLPNLISPLFAFLVITISISAFLFSIYLTFIQAFAIKEWCTWCLMSAGLCLIIFAMALFVSEFGFITLLDRYHTIILIGHILGVALGLGGVTINDILFFKFLKDFRISEWEAEIMHTISQIIWFALALMVITGIGLYLPEADRLSQSAKFLVKTIVVAIIIINGAFLNILIAPKLVKISFHEKQDNSSGILQNIRKLAFALGAVSIVSWYSAFILGMLKQSPISFFPLLLLYILLVTVAVIVSQFVEKSL